MLRKHKGSVTKTEQVIELALRPEGVTVAEIIKKLRVTKNAANSLIGDIKHKVKRLDRRKEQGGVSTYYAVGPVHMPANPPPPKRLLLDRRAERLIEDYQGLNSDLLNTEQVALWLGVSPWWLLEGRYRGYGPEFEIHGQNIFYQRGKVRAWLKTRAYAFKGGEGIAG